MQRTKLGSVAIGLLALALAASFVWCVIDNVVTSVAMAEAGVEMAVNTRTVVSGVTWLVSHGVHGAAVVAVPVVFARRTAADIGLGLGKEIDSGIGAENDRLFGP